MPVALMFDGPSLGGFVCPATITSTEIWKMGQVSANDKVRFKQLSLGAHWDPKLQNYLNYTVYFVEVLQMTARMPQLLQAPRASCKFPG